MTEVTVRPNPVIATLSLGVILGAALAAGGCAHGDKKEAPPVLPPARVDYTRGAGPRQVTVAGPLHEVEKRANTLMMGGWRAVPHSMGLSGDGSSTYGLMVLEYRPVLAKK